MTNKSEIQILDDIDLDGIVGGRRKKKATKKKATKKKNASNKQATVDVVTPSGNTIQVAQAAAAQSNAFNRES